MKLELLVIHCTFTPSGRNITKEDIEQWHLKERGWSRVGYSDIIHLNGALENLIDWNQDDIVDPWEISNGAKGYNSKARHIVYVGGANKDMSKAKDTRTWEQELSLLTYVNFIILRNPDIKVCGHNQLSNKECPSFDVPAWLRLHCIPEKNILQD